jgi:glycosyltransferase involved in cell wall biosynthesis
MALTSKKISLIVPLYNEEENIRELITDITTSMEHSGLEYELILVDDGSTDATFSILEKEHKNYTHLKLIQLRRNFGQTSAMAAGFDLASGDVVIPLDGDLQNDPNDIPRLVAKLEEGYDVVSGWRKDRKDKFITRKIPSWTANFLISKITGVPLHDYGCTLKAYRSEVVKHTQLYGEMHRFIPALAKWAGANVTEIVVNHRPRIYGKTKYGLSRTIKVILDLITVKFLGSFSTKPIHIFGGLGLMSLLGAFICTFFVLYLKYSHHNFSMNRNPLLIVGAVLGMASVQFLLMGLIAEMLARTYHESQKKPTYIIRTIIDSTEETESDKIQ